jgi:hypothetical protein
MAFFAIEVVSFEDWAAIQFYAEQTGNLVHARWRFQPGSDVSLTSDPASQAAAWSITEEGVRLSVTQATGTDAAHRRLIARIQVETDIGNVLVGVMRSSGQGVFVTTGGNTAAFNRAGPNDNFQFVNMRVHGAEAPVEEHDRRLLADLSAEMDVEGLKAAENAEPGRPKAR